MPDVDQCVDKHVVLLAMDRIVVTEPGQVIPSLEAFYPALPIPNELSHSDAWLCTGVQTPPDLGAELPEPDHERDLRRSGRSPEIAFRTDPVYSFSFHNPFTDFTKWEMRGLPTGPIQMRQFLGYIATLSQRNPSVLPARTRLTPSVTVSDGSDLPIHMVVYDVNPRVEDPKTAPHKNRDKRYYFSVSAHTLSAYRGAAPRRRANFDSYIARLCSAP